MVIAKKSFENAALRLAFENLWRLGLLCCKQVAQLRAPSRGKDFRILVSLCSSSHLLHLCISSMLAMLMLTSSESVGGTVSITQHWDPRTWALDRWSSNAGIQNAFVNAWRILQTSIGQPELYPQHFSTDHMLLAVSVGASRGRRPRLYSYLIEAFPTDPLNRPFRGSNAGALIWTAFSDWGPFWTHSMRWVLCPSPSSILYKWLQKTPLLSG